MSSPTIASIMNPAGFLTASSVASALNAVSFRAPSRSLELSGLGLTGRRRL
jgi:hypothetical protein